MVGKDPTALMAELFQTTPQDAMLHLRTLLQEREIDEAAICQDYLQVHAEGDARSAGRFRQRLPCYLR